MQIKDTPSAISFTLHTPISVRLAAPEDLPRLEWFGQFAHLRRIMSQTLQEQRQGSRFMLVAEFNTYPIGTISAHILRGDLLHPGRRRVYFYSLRVLEIFQGRGIGSVLLQTAEDQARSRGCVTASIAAAKHNQMACSLYQRRGYHITGEDAGEWSYIDHLGKLRQVHEPCWILEKALTFD
jgi:ribosomal protein S18 acetylase RimI-like enzyme